MMKRFSLGGLIAVIAVIALFVAYLVSQFQFRYENRTLEYQTIVLSEEVSDLKIQLESARNQDLRATHEAAVCRWLLRNPELHPEIIEFIDRPDHLFGFAAHPLPDHPGIVYGCFYNFLHPVVYDDKTIATNSSNYFISKMPKQTPKCYCFLIQSEPFKVVQHVAGGQSKMPLQTDGAWVFGCSEERGDGEINLYQILKDRFVPYTEESHADWLKRPTVEDQSSLEE